MSKITIGPNMGPMVKSDFHFIWPCVKSLNGNVGQTTAFDWLNVVRVFTMVFQPITTFIPIKQSFHSIKSKDTKATNPRTCKHDQWIGFIGFETIPSMSKLIFYHHFFNILLRGKILEMFHSTAICISPCWPYKNSKTWAWGMFAVSIATLFWSPCQNPSFHTKSTFKKGDFAGFWISMDWDNGIHPMLWIVKGITL